jgi:hypothetical protein
MGIKYSERAEKQIKRIHKGDKLKEIEEDRNDYYAALEVKIKNKKWKSHADLKKELNL